MSDSMLSAVFVMRQKTATTNRQQPTGGFQGKRWRGSSPTPLRGETIYLSGSPPPRTSSPELSPANDDLPSLLTIGTVQNL